MDFCYKFIYNLEGIADSRTVRKLENEAMKNDFNKVVSQFLSYVHIRTPTCIIHFTIILV